MEDLIDFFNDDQPRFSNMRLPSFWVDKPASWFALAESRFRLHNVTREQVKFDLLVSSLSKDSVGLVIDIIENPPADRPYSVLRARLLSSHQLTDYQRVEKLLHMEPLGGRKPSELLAAMLELCPRGEESNIFFTHLFLQRLPAELRIMLGEDDHQDPRPLAEKADQLWALHGGRMASVATVDLLVDEPAQVAAVASRGQSRGGGRVRGGGRGSTRGGGHSGNSRAAATSSAAPVGPSTTPSDLARMGTGICHYHWSYGEKARTCVAPCGWGN